MAWVITVASTDRTSCVDLATLTILDQTGAQPRTATFSCFGFAPATGDAISIVNGAETAIDGHLIRVTRIHRKLNARVVYRVEAVDGGLYHADTYLATGAWASLTTAFTNIWAGTEGTTDPATAIFSASLEDVVACSDRLAAQYGGWWYRDRATNAASLYANTATITAGPTIGTTDTDWWDLEWLSDAAQVRDKVYAYGPSIAFGAYANATAPVSASDYALVGAGLTCVMGGCDLVTVTVSQDPTNNTPAFPTTNGATAAGATSVTVNTMSAQGATNWWRVGGMLIYGTWSNATTMVNVPASGSGSITADIPSGSVLDPQYSVAVASPHHAPVIPASCAPYTSYGSGTHLRVLGAYRTLAEALAAATNEHGVWSANEIRGRVMTTDVTAYAGNAITINIAGLSSQVYRIERVTLTWDLAKGTFVRLVEFAKMKRDLLRVLYST